MARVAINKPERIDDPIIQEIFSWVTEMEGAVPNHFYVEMNFPELLKAKLGTTKVLWQLGELSMVRNSTRRHCRFQGQRLSLLHGCFLYDFELRPAD